MTKTIEEALAEYKDYLSTMTLTNGERFRACNGFIEGYCYAIYKLPLNERLNADEADLIRKEYNNTYPLDPDCGVANILIQGVLHRIFGKDFFKEDKE